MERRIKEIIAELEGMILGWLFTDEGDIDMPSLTSLCEELESLWPDSDYGISLALIRGFLPEIWREEINGQDIWIVSEYEEFRWQQGFAARHPKLTSALRLFIGRLRNVRKQERKEELEDMINAIAHQMEMTEEEKMLLKRFRIETLDKLDRVIERERRRAHGY